MPAISAGLGILLGSVAGAGIGAVGSDLAAGAQAGAARSAAGLEAQSAANSLAEQRREFDITQGNFAPFLKAGTSGINLLSQLLSTPGQGLLTPWTGNFVAPTADQARATPGYQFLAGAGSGAIENSAAASGNLLSTGTLKTLSQFNQGLADTTYSSTYNRAFNEYLQRYNEFQGNQTNTFNRLASVSGIGQTTATTLGQLGQEAANNTANINLTSAGQIGNALMFGGSARASGYAGIANALTSGIGNVNQYMLLNRIFKNNASGNNFTDVTPNYLDPNYTTNNPGFTGVPT